MAGKLIYASTYLIYKGVEIPVSFVVKHRGKIGDLLKWPVDQGWRAVEGVIHGNTPIEEIDSKTTNETSKKQRIFHLLNGPTFSDKFNKLNLREKKWVLQEANRRFSNFQKFSKKDLHAEIKQDDPLQTDITNILNAVLDQSRFRRAISKAVKSTFQTTGKIAEASWEKAGDKIHGENPVYEHSANNEEQKDQQKKIFDLLNQDDFVDRFQKLNKLEQRWVIRAAHEKFNQYNITNNEDLFEVKKKDDKLFSEAEKILNELLGKPRFRRATRKVWEKSSTVTKDQWDKRKDSKEKIKKHYENLKSKVENHFKIMRDKFPKRKKRSKKL